MPPQQESRLERNESYSPAYLTGWDVRYRENDKDRYIYKRKNGVSIHILGYHIGSDLYIEDIAIVPPRSHKASQPRRYVDSLKWPISPLEKRVENEPSAFSGIKQH